MWSVIIFFELLNWITTLMLILCVFEWIKFHFSIIFRFYNYDLNDNGVGLMFSQTFFFSIATIYFSFGREFKDVSITKWWWCGDTRSRCSWCTALRWWWCKCWCFLSLDMFISNKVFNSLETEDEKARNVHAFEQIEFD